MSGWLGQTLLATTLLMAAVLVLRAPVRRMFGARAAYLLWAIPLLRLVMPSLPQVAPQGSPIAAPMKIVVAAANEAPASVDWLLALWGAGALLFGLMQVVRYLGFVRSVDRDAASVPSIGPEVWTTAAVTGPVAAGLLRPRILLPHDYRSRYSPEELALAVAHERVHLARRDLWANAAATGLLALHWFNPLAHRAFRAFREDQEMSCDAAVIGEAANEARAAYAAAMVKSAGGAGWAVRAGSPIVCPMSRSANLKRRLSMIKTHNKSRAASIGGAFATAAIAAAGLTLTATSGIAAEPTIKKITVKRIGGEADLAGALGKELGQSCEQGARYESSSKAVKDGKPVETRLIFCNKGGATPATRLSAMTAARQAIATSTDLTPEQRERALAGLDKAIAELKAGQ